MILLKFKYINHKGDDHEYVIEPTGVEFFAPSDPYAGSYAEHWVLSGNTLERDGKARMVGRRSFKLTELRDVEQVEGEWPVSEASA